MNKPVFALMCSLAFLAFSSNAYAYIDPGAGSIILQILIGGVAGVAVAGKLYWHRVKDFFRGFGKRDAA